MHFILLSLKSCDIKTFKTPFLKKTRKLKPTKIHASLNLLVLTC